MWKGFDYSGVEQHFQNSWGKKTLIWSGWKGRTSLENTDLKLEAAIIGQAKQTSETKQQSVKVLEQKIESILKMDHYVQLLTTLASSLDIFRNELREFKVNEYERDTWD